MDEFLRHYEECRPALERYVRFRIASPHDAEDILQEVLAAAVAGFPALRETANVRGWLIGIARNKCMDFLRRRYARPETPVESLPEGAVFPKHVQSGMSAVQEALAFLSPAEQEVLHLCYWLEMPQEDIAARLGVPIGTVKSRLHHAREHFRNVYPQRHPMKGAMNMKKMPLVLPEYTIVERSDAPFPVKWEETMGWFVVPRLGEKLSWAMYDQPDRVRTEVDDMEVVGRAQVHGIEGVEIRATTRNPMECNAIDGGDGDRTFVAQLTDTHCRFLAETHFEGGVKRMYTFLDGGDFLDNWGFGEDNCGNETNLRVKGDIHREGDVVTSAEKAFLLDVVGRYDVTIGGKTYDTICVMDLETYVEGMATEQYIDRNGRTVLWRRFNADDWHVQDGRTWSQRLPESQRLTINGRTFVHWYDCITSYIL